MGRSKSRHKKGLFRIWSGHLIGLAVCMRGGGFVRGGTGRSVRAGMMMHAMACVVM